MAVNTSNIIQGPADIYVGAFGATEPAETLIALQTKPTSPTWRDAGATTESVDITFVNSTSEIEVQQAVEIVGRRVTRREVTVETSMAETTLDNLNDLLTGSSYAPVVDGVNKFEPASGLDSNPVFKAVILDGLGKNYLRRRLILRKVMNTDDVEYAYDKEEVSVFSVSLSTHFVSSSIKSWALYEEDPAAEVA